MTSATTRVRFMANNFLENAMTYSSQNSIFPATNATNKSRSKFWIPGGNFEITSGNRVIYFIDDGTNRSVSIDTGTYTATALATEITSKIAGVSVTVTFTCDYNQSGASASFRFVTTGGTGHLRLGQTTNAIWDTIGYLGTDDRQVSSSVFRVADDQRIHTSEWLKCDMGVPQLATFVALISEVDELFPFSDEAKLYVQGNNIDDWTSPPLNQEIPLSNYGFIGFIDGENDDPYRYWRLKIVDRKNFMSTSTASEVSEKLKTAYAYIGNDTTLTLTNVATGFRKELVDPSYVLESESGALYFENRPRYLSISGAQIQLLNGSELSELEQLLFELGRRTPFFISLDPGVEVTSEVGDLTRFVVMTNNPSLDHVIRDYYNVNFEFREAF